MQQDPETAAGPSRMQQLQYGSRMLVAWCCSTAAAAQQHYRIDRTTGARLPESPPSRDAGPSGRGPAAPAQMAGQTASAGPGKTAVVGPGQPARLDSTA